MLVLFPGVLCWLVLTWLAFSPEWRRRVWRRYLAPRWSGPPIRHPAYRWWTSGVHADGTVKLGPVAFARYSYPPSRGYGIWPLAGSGAWARRWHVDICVLNRWGWALWPIRGNAWRSRKT